MNKIQYTSTDGKAILTNPINKEEFGNEIVEHKYKDGVGTISFKNELLTIPKAFFRGAWTLESIIIPPSVKMIEDEAFTKCRHLKAVKLQEGLHSIGERAFSFTEIESVVIPSSVLVICKEAFSHCENLTSVKICKPKSACVIGNHCFHESPTELAII